MIDLLQIYTESGLLQAEKDVLKQICDYTLIAMRQYEHCNFRGKYNDARHFYNSLKCILDNYEFRIIEQKLANEES